MEMRKCSIFVLFIIMNFALTTSSNSDHLITKLIGQPKNISFLQYSGRITVDNDGGRALYYWLVEANNRPMQKPLVLWMNGGPGCSTIGAGALQGIGPFRVQDDGISLSTNPHAWNREVNVLFLESPAGVGFSVLQKPKKQGDNTTAEDAYRFLLKWLQRFPQYKYRDFYLAGESYAGHYIPQLAQVLLRRKIPYINLKGFLLGNPIIDTFNDYLGQIEYWWSHGIISESTNNLLKKYCPTDSFIHPGPLCKKAISAAQAEFGSIDPYNIFADSCDHGDLVGHDETARIFGGSEFCLLRRTFNYLNNLDVQKSMHADISGRLHPWKPCSNTIFNQWTDSPSSVLPIFKELIAAKLRIWIFSGDLDSQAPFMSTRKSLKALNISISKSWYPWMDTNGQVGGWAEAYKGLSFITIRSAGHQVPLNRPDQAMFLLKKFLGDERLPVLDRNKAKAKPRSRA